MGFQTDVVIADINDAQAIADSDSPASERSGFTFNGFDRVQLCTLLSLLKSGDSESHFDRYLDSIEIVRSSIDEWPVVSVVKPVEAADLALAASLEDQQFDRLAVSWSETEEFNGWADSDVRILLRELTDLADSAALQKKCLMIWQSP